MSEMLEVTYVAEVPLEELERVVSVAKFRYMVGTGTLKDYYLAVTKLSYHLGLKIEQQED